jgi:hypothetical protein
MRGRLPALALLLCLAVVLPAVAAGDEARVAGSWTVDGQRLELGHARVFREADPFGKGTNPCVLASKEAVPDAAVPDDDEGIAELLDLVRSGTLRALQVCFDASGTKLRGVNDVFVFHPGISPGRFGFQGFHRFAAKATAGRIAGRLSGAGETNAGGTWSDEVEISVAMPAE